MGNRLIFLYHLIRAKAESELLRKAFGPTDPLMAESEGVTQEGSWTHALVDVGQACRRVS